MPKYRNTKTGMVVEVLEGTKICKGYELIANETKETMQKISKTPKPKKPAKKSPKKAVMEKKNPVEKNPKKPATVEDASPDEIKQPEPVKETGESEV